MNLRKLNINKKFGDMKKYDGWMGLSLPQIIAEYGENESLNGDDVDNLVDILRAKINLNQGNCTDEEYEEMLNNL